MTTRDASKRRAPPLPLPLATLQDNRQYSVYDLSYLSTAIRRDIKRHITTMLPDEMQEFINGQDSGVTKQDMLFFSTQTLKEQIRYKIIDESHTQDCSFTSFLYDLIYDSMTVRKYLEVEIYLFGKSQRTRKDPAPAPAPAPTPTLSHLSYFS
jgi:hypothetical protein